MSAATASLTVAKPGESEHQLGLAMDVQCPDTLTLSSNFAQTDEGRWVEENAHRFGFIIRYKAEWKSMTGYNYEPWHIRYIGVAHATAVHMLNIPYETYYEQVIRLPEYVLTQGNPYLLAGAVQDLINGDESILALLPPTLRIPTPRCAEPRSGICLRIPPISRPCGWVILPPCPRPSRAWIPTPRNTPTARWRTNNHAFAARSASCHPDAAPAGAACRQAAPAGLP